MSLARVVHSRVATVRGEDRTLFPCPVALRRVLWGGGALRRDRVNPPGAYKLPRKKYLVKEGVGVL